MAKSQHRQERRGAAAERRPETGGGSRKPALNMQASRNEVKHESRTERDDLRISSETHPHARAANESARQRMAADASAKEASFEITKTVDRPVAPMLVMRIGKRSCLPAVLVVRPK